jgi:hypothetical protein
MSKFLAILSAALVIATCVAIRAVVVLSSPPKVSVGTRLANPYGDLAAQITRRKLPPFTSGCISGSSRILLYDTCYFIRPLHPFAFRSTRYLFDTNGIVTAITSRWNFQWDL